MRIELGDDLVVDHHRVDLLVERDGAGVQVGRADAGDAPVDRHDLGVEHGRLVVPEAHAALQQPVVLRLPGQLDEALVGVGTGEEDVDLHPPGRGVAQPVGELRVGHEVRGRDPDPLVRQLQQGPEERRHVAPADLRGAPHALHQRRPGLGLVGEAVDRLVEELRARLGPVVQERRAQPVDRRPFDAEVGVAPLVLVASVALPAVGDADPTGEPDGLVGDQHLAVGAVVDLAGPEPSQRSVPVDLCSGVLEAGEHLLVHGVRAPGVEQHPHADARLGPVAQVAAELLADLAGPVDEGEEVDRVLGLVDGLEHRREDLLAVAQDPHAVALRGRDAEHPLEGATDAGCAVSGGGAVVVGVRARPADIRHGTHCCTVASGTRTVTASGWIRIFKRRVGGRSPPSSS